MEKKLYRSRSNYMLAGVCGGLGEYLTIDPIIIRIFFIVFALADGIGFLIYLILWFIIPRDETVMDSGADHYASARQEMNIKARQMGDEFSQAVRHYNKDTSKFIGIAFILTGCLFMFKEFINVWLPFFNNESLGAILLILGGVVLLWHTLRNKER